MNYRNIICDTCKSRIYTGCIIYKAYDGNFCSKNCENVKHNEILNLNCYEENPYLWNLYKIKQNEPIKPRIRSIKKSKSYSTIYKSTIDKSTIYKSISTTSLISFLESSVKLSYMVVRTLTNVFSSYGFNNIDISRHFHYPII